MAIPEQYEELAAHLAKFGFSLDHARDETPDRPGRFRAWNGSTGVELFAVTPEKLELRLTSHLAERARRREPSTLAAVGVTTRVSKPAAKEPVRRVTVAKK